MILFQFIFMALIGVIPSTIIAYVFFTKKKSKLHDVYIMWLKQQDEKIEFKDWQRVQDFKDNVLACYAAYCVAAIGFGIISNL